MTNSCVRAVVLALLFVVPAALVAQTPATSDADQHLKALYTAEWDWRQQELARVPGQVGSRAEGDHLPRVDAASQQRRLEYWQKTLADLDRIALERLSPEEKINAQIFRAVLEEQIVDVRYKNYEAPFNSDTFFWTISRRAKASRLPTSIGAISAGCAMCRASSTSRSSTCAPVSSAASPFRRCR